MSEGAVQSTGEQLRNKIRERIFSSEQSRAKKLAISFFGTQIELRTPAVGKFLGSISQNADDGSNDQIRLVKLLIENAYVPDTDELVFNMADYESLVALPFNNDMALVVKTINELTGVDLKAKEKN